MAASVLAFALVALAATACGSGSSANDTNTFNEEGFQFTFEYPASFGTSEDVRVAEHAVRDAGAR